MSAFRPAPLKPLVNFSALQALDLRVGEILAAEKVPASSKLVRLTVSFGDHTRTILAGLQKERENLQALVGWQTLFVINLEPKRLAGEVSEGMLLAFSMAGLAPLRPEKRGVDRCHHARIFCRLVRGRDSRGHRPHGGQRGRQRSSLSRARRRHSDHRSCATTGDQDSILGDRQHRWLDELRCGSYVRNAFPSEREQPLGETGERDRRLCDDQHGRSGAARRSARGSDHRNRAGLRT